MRDRDTILRVPETHVEQPTSVETRLTKDEAGDEAGDEPIEVGVRSDLQLSRVGDVIVISSDSLRMPASLSESEQAVARAVIAGHSNAEIARVRGTSAKTVANQLYAMYRKLEVGTREELVAMLVDGALVSDADCLPTPGPGLISADDHQQS